MEGRFSLGKTQKVLGDFLGKMTREPVLTRTLSTWETKSSLADLTWRLNWIADSSKSLKSIFSQRLSLSFLRVHPGVSNLAPDKPSWLLPLADPLGKGDNFIPGSEKPSFEF